MPHQQFQARQLLEEVVLDVGFKIYHRDHGSIMPSVNDKYWSSIFTTDMGCGPTKLNAYCKDELIWLAHLDQIDESVYDGRYFYLTDPESVPKMIKFLESFKRV